MKAEIKDALYIRCLQKIITSLRKIGEEMIINATPDSLSIRTINTTRSALPDVTFNREFFSEYVYTSTEECLCFQVSINGPITAFKNANNATSLSLIINPETSKFFMGLNDKYGIVHEWEFFLNDTQLLSAVYDINESTILINCRNDIFKGVGEAFKSKQNIFMEIQKEPHTCLVFKSFIDTETILSSKMTITTSEKCDIQFLESCDNFLISFSLPDFLVGLKIAYNLSQKLSISMIEPGYPLILKAEMSSLAVFEMPLATATNEPKEEQAEQEGPQETEIQSNKLNDPTYSQVAPWQTPEYHAHPETTKTTQPMTYSENLQNVEYGNSQNSYDDSQTQSPFKRKRMIGQYVAASQPQSDSDELDL